MYDIEAAQNIRWTLRKTSIMSREEKSREVKNKILDVTRDLLLAQGYKITTIRQVIEKAGIKTGTLYHFFRDKEDILLHLVIQTFNEFMQTAEGIVGKEKDGALKYALIYALEMKMVERYDRIAELYLESYSSWRITQAMLGMNIQRNKDFFHKYNEHFTDQDYYIRTLALRGMRLSFIAERVRSGAVDFDVKCPFLIETDLSMFNVPKNKIETALSRAKKVTKKDTLAIHGLTI
jgi:AcrR family transcriptional regulator